MVGARDRLVLVLVALPLATGLLKHKRATEEAKTPDATGAISLLETGAISDVNGDLGDSGCACDYTLGGRKRLHRKRDCACQRSAPSRAGAGAPEPLHEPTQAGHGYGQSSRAPADSAPGQGLAAADTRWLPPRYRGPHYSGPLGVTGPVRRMPDPPPQAPQEQAAPPPQTGPQTQARLPWLPIQLPSPGAATGEQALQGQQAPAAVDARGRPLAGLPLSDAGGPASGINMASLVPLSEAVARKMSAKAPAPLFYPMRKKKVEKVDVRPQIAFGHPSIDEYTNEIRIPIDSTALTHGEQYQLGKPVEYGQQMWVPLSRVGGTGTPSDAGARMRSRSVGGTEEPPAWGADEPGPGPEEEGPDEQPVRLPRGRRLPVEPEDEELDDRRVREMSVHPARGLPLPIRAPPVRASRVPLAPLPLAPPLGRYGRSPYARPAYRPPAYPYGPAPSEQPPYPYEEPPYWSSPYYAQPRAYPQ